MEPIVLDAIDERAKRTYARMGFESLESQPDRMVISIAKLRRNAAAADRREIYEAARFRV